MTRIETRYGSLSVPEAEVDVIGRFLARYGEWAWDEARFVAGTLPATGARVLDVGAFLGTFGLGVALQRHLGFLCLVEANGTVAPLLADNVERNCPAPAVVVEALVGWPDLEGMPGRCEPGNMGAMSFVGERDAVDGGMVAAPPRQVVTLAELRAAHGTFDLVKLDVEGMELDILRSDAEYLALGGTTLWVECNEDPRSLALAELLLSWDLDLYYFAFPAHNPDNFRGDPIPIFPFAYEAGLLAAPKSTPALDDALRVHRCILRSVGSVDDVKDALWRTPRWGAPEWVGVGLEEVAALAAHQLRGERFDTYLRPGWRQGELLDEGLKAQFHATQAGLWEAEALALDRLNQVATERERADAAEELLARATALALDRLAELGAERERTAAAESRVAELEHSAPASEARAVAAEVRAAAIETSTVWRLTESLRRFIGARPHLRSGLRRGIRAAATVLGRRR